jgi:hypothetical protein
VRHDSENDIDVFSQVPMLVIGGKSDRLFRPDEVRATAAEYKTGTVTET